MPMPKDKAPYHHGDLRAALLEAGEVILSETGVEGFSLRRVAREVGVSHAAPAHHFGDTAGLLDALAAEGFRRFLKAMQDRQLLVDPMDKEELLMASGLGYLDFATSSPALFRLMFMAEKSDEASDERRAAAQESFDHLLADVARLLGRSPLEDPDGMADVMANWAMVHGFAELLVSGRMGPVQQMPRDQREAFFRRVFERAAPRRDG